MPPSGQRIHPWRWMIGICTALSIGALAAWIWLQQALTSLPSPRSNSGEALLYRYNRSSHDLFLALLGISILALLWRAYRSSDLDQSSDREKTHEPPKRPKPWPKICVDFAREHPFVLMLFAAYAVAMVHGTNWFYPELVGWYDGIIDHHLLDNFSIRHDFIKETMLRNDYRFFPLAHQDLHVLSWFTAYVKIWMVVSAAELFAIILLAYQLIRRLSPTLTNKSLLLIISLLMLSAPATGFTFFQLIYAERILTLCFIGFGLCYLHYQQTGSQRSQYLTLTFALVGMFFKEIGVLLFVTPAAFTLIAGASGFMDGYPALRWSSFKQRAAWSEFKAWLTSYQLELWICSLIVVFLLSYVFLSYLPSIYHGKESYSSNDIFQFLADPRCWIPTAYIILRSTRILIHNSRIQLLDGLNAASLAYGASLYALVGYDGTSYMAMPVQLVAVLDLAFAWTNWISPRLSQSVGNSAAVSGIGILSCIGVIGLEHQADQTFLNRVERIKTRQASWLTTFNEIDSITRDTKRSGEEVNLIFTKSWFRPKRHLDRFHYDRLIFLDPKKNTYSIVDGINKGETYTPKQGDLLINIDKGGLGFLGQEIDSFELTYRYSENIKNGRIYRYRGSAATE